MKVKYLSLAEALTEEKKEEVIANGKEHMVKFSNFIILCENRKSVV